MSKRVTTADFIERAKAVHGDRYDYSLVEYQSNHKHVTIVCGEHGQFQQSPANHYQGKGCLDCGGSKPHTTESFVEAAKAVHTTKEWHLIKRRGIITVGWSRVAMAVPKADNTTEIHWLHLTADSNELDEQAIIDKFNQLSASAGVNLPWSL